MTAVLIFLAIIFGGEAIASHLCTEEHEQLVDVRKLADDSRVRKQTQPFGRRLRYAKTYKPAIKKPAVD